MRKSHEGGGRLDGTYEEVQVNFSQVIMAAKGTWYEVRHFLLDGTGPRTGSFRESLSKERKKKKTVKSTPTLYTFASQDSLCQPQRSERKVDRRIVAKLKRHLGRAARLVLKRLDEVPDVERAEDGAHLAGEVVPERAVHEEVELVLERLDLARRERAAPRRRPVRGEVVRARVQRAVHVVRRQLRRPPQGFVQPFGDRRQVHVAPRNRGLSSRVSFLGTCECGFFKDGGERTLLP